MITTPRLRLKKGEDRRIKSGHPWIYSNEIDIAATPLKKLQRGQEIIIEAQDKTPIGIGYVNPHSLIAARLLSLDPNVSLDKNFFVQQIKNALALREHLFAEPYYRLVFGESDQLPGLVIDRFANDFVVQINTAGMELKSEIIIAALREVFPDLTSILLKNDSQVRIQEGLELYVKPAFGQPKEEITVNENGVQFVAPLLNGQKTGWFYDHRLNRARLKAYVKNKRVLDVFSYAGGWGIEAAVFGASEVDCIEISELAAAFITRNASLNDVSDKIHVICEDAFDAMKKLLHEKKSYDVIILDPPAFVKKFKDRKEGFIAYQRLNEFALKLLNPGGILFSCSCSMHISMEDMLELLKRAAYRTQHSIQLLERGHQGPDHPLHICIPETDYLKAVVVRKVF
jgi:23S rRNA (cytosine1962-C5)-methyltransferase